MFNTEPNPLKVIIAGVNLNDANFEYQMTELASLAAANRMIVVGRVQQNLPHLIAASYFGLGKVNELKNLAHGLGARVILLNDELTPVQIRNLEKDTKLRVIDRTELILEIFAGRAKSRQASLQVQLARLQYELPRLHPSDNTLDQQRGGGVANRGAGESKLEINRRTIGKQIAVIKQELANVTAQENLKANRRNQSELPKVALVGYTNAGKSTTMNGLLQLSTSNHAKSKTVLAKDMLFATLDTAVRRIDLEQQVSFILSDTVGFVSKLPHQLIAAFKATLQEVRDADLIINVVDAADPHMSQMIATTKAVLNEIGIKDTPMITAYNKADRTQRPYPELQGDDLRYAANDAASIKLLAELIVKRVFAHQHPVHLILPVNAGKLLSYLHEHAQITQEIYQADGIHVIARVAKPDLAKVAAYEVAPTKITE